MRKPTGKSGAELFIVPRLEELVADPGQVNVLDIETARILRTRAISALNLLHGYDVEHASMIVGGYAQPRDRLLNVKQAAEKLGVKVGWLYSPS